jgi:hypothetical protein
MMGPEDRENTAETPGATRRPKLLYGSEIGNRFAANGPVLVYVECARSPETAPVSASKPSKPAAETVRSSGWIATLLLLVGVLTFVYAGLFRYSFTQWLKPDYSHGFLVPFFAVYLAYHWREWAPTRFRWPEPWGLAFIAGGSVLFVVAAKFNIAKEWLQGL